MERLDLNQYSGVRGRPSGRRLETRQSKQRRDRWSRRARSGRGRRTSAGGQREKVITEACKVNGMTCVTFYTLMGGGMVLCLMGLVLGVWRMMASRQEGNAVDGTKEDEGSQCTFK